MSLKDQILRAANKLRSTTVDAAEWTQEGIGRIFRSQSERAAENEKAKQMLANKQRFNKENAVIMDRILTNLDIGDLGPYYNRSSPAHTEAGGITPKYPTPWSMPREGFERMVNTGEFEDPSLIDQLMGDYDSLVARKNWESGPHRDIEAPKAAIPLNPSPISKAFEMEKLKKDANLGSENDKYWPEEGY